MKNFIPSKAPGSCALFINRAIRITYGNRAVKYTTCKQEHTLVSFHFFGFHLCFTYLSCWFHSLEDAEINKNPSQNKEQKKLPSHCSGFVNSIGLFQNPVSKKKKIYTRFHSSYDSDDSTLTKFIAFHTAVVPSTALSHMVISEWLTLIVVQNLKSPNKNVKKKNQHFKQVITQ